MDQIKKYEELTGDSFSDLMQGSSTFGPDFILNELLPQALKENKKIVWIPELIEGEDLGIVTYTLKNI